MGLTIGGYFLFPALADGGEWNDGLGHDIALGEIFAIIGAAMAASIASIAEGSDLTLGIAAASAGVGTGLAGVLIGVALEDEERYEDQRVLPLLGASAFSVLTALVAALVAGIGGFEHPWDEVLLVTGERRPRRRPRHDRARQGALIVRSTSGAGATRAVTSGARPRERE